MTAIEQPYYEKICRKYVKPHVYPLRRLYVSGFPESTTKTDLRKAFEPVFGRVTWVEIEESKTSGFVTFKEEHHCVAALDGRVIVHGTELVKRQATYVKQQIFVGGFGRNVNNQMLFDFFHNNYGFVCDVKIKVHAGTGLSRCFGFVTFVDEQGMVTDLIKKRFIDVLGKRVEIKEAEPLVPQILARKKQQSSYLHNIQEAVLDDKENVPLPSPVSNPFGEDSPRIADIVEEGEPHRKYGETSPREGFVDHKRSTPRILAERERYARRGIYNSERHYRTSLSKPACYESYKARKKEHGETLWYKERTEASRENYGYDRRYDYRRDPYGSRLEHYRQPRTRYPPDFDRYDRIPHDYVREDTLRRSVEVPYRRYPEDYRRHPGRREHSRRRDRYVRPIPSREYQTFIEATDAKYEPRNSSALNSPIGRKDASSSTLSAVASEFVPTPPQSSSKTLSAVARPFVETSRPSSAEQTLVSLESWLSIPEAHSISNETHFSLKNVPRSYQSPAQPDKVNNFESPQLAKQFQKLSINNSTQEPQELV